MSTLVSFASIIGVIVGFLLGWLKDYIQNKPKLKVNNNIRMGKFSYYKIVSDEEGFVKECPCTPDEADFLSLKLLVDIYNIGKASTAVREIDIELKTADGKMYFVPQVKLKESEPYTENISFNVAPGNIQTAHIDLVVKRDENTGYLFKENISYDPEEEGRLLFIVNIKDIYNKEIRIVVEPLSILMFF